jgi:hypothetical protein
MGERAQLMCTPGRPLARHHHQLIPTREHVQRGQIVKLGQAVTQLFESIHPLKRMASHRNKRVLRPIGASSQNVPRG